MPEIPEDFEQESTDLASHIINARRQNLLDWVNSGQAAMEYAQFAQPQIVEAEPEPGAVSEFGKGLVRGTLGMAELAPIAGKLAAKLVGSKSLEEAADRLSDWLVEQEQAWARGVQDSIWENPWNIINPKFLAATIGETLPSLVATFGTGGLAFKAARLAGLRLASAKAATSPVIRFLTKEKVWTPELAVRLARLHAMAGGGSIGGLLEGASTFNEIKRRGGTDWDALSGMTLMAAASSALNAIGLNPFLRAPGNIASPITLKSIFESANIKTPRLRRMIIQGGTEALTEWLEEPTEAAIKYGISDQYNWDDFKQQMAASLDVLPASFILGSLAGLDSKYTASRHMLDSTGKLKTQTNPEHLQLVLNSIATIQQAKHPLTGVTYRIGVTNPELTARPEELEHIAQSRWTLRLAKITPQIERITNSALMYVIPEARPVYFGGVYIGRNLGWFDGSSVWVNIPELAISTDEEYAKLPIEQRVKTNKAALFAAKLLDVISHETTHVLSLDNKDPRFLKYEDRIKEWVMLNSAQFIKQNLNVFEEILNDPDFQTARHISYNAATRQPDIRNVSRTTTEVQEWQNIARLAGLPVSWFRPETGALSSSLYAGRKIPVKSWTQWRKLAEERLGVKQLYVGPVPKSGIPYKIDLFLSKVLGQSIRPEHAPHVFSAATWLLEHRPDATKRMLSNSIPKQNEALKVLQNDTEAVAALRAIIFGQPQTTQAAQEGIEQEQAEQEQQPQEQAESQQAVEQQAPEQQPQQPEQQEAPQPAQPIYAPPPAPPTAQTQTYTENTTPFENVIYEVDPKNIKIVSGIQFKLHELSAKKRQEPGLGLRYAWPKGAKYDPHGAKVLTVTRSPVTGEIVVIDGHHRLALAIQNNVPSVRVEFKLPPPNINTQDDFISWARMEGALSNLQQGKGSALDVAALIRSTPELFQKSKQELEEFLARRHIYPVTNPNTQNILEDGIALGLVANKYYERYVSNKEHGVRDWLDIDRIRELVYHFPTAEEQGPVVDSIDKMQQDAGGHLRPEVIDELIGIYSSMPKKEVSQKTLFGNLLFDFRAIENRAKLTEEVLRWLRTSSAVLSSAAKRKQVLEWAGNKIDAEQSKALSQKYALAEYYLRPDKPNKRGGALLYTRDSRGIAQLASELAHKVAEKEITLEQAREELINYALPIIEEIDGSSGQPQEQNPPVPPPPPEATPGAMPSKTNDTLIMLAQLFGKPVSELSFEEFQSKVTATPITQGEGSTPTRFHVETVLGSWPFATTEGYYFDTDQGKTEAIREIYNRYQRIESPEATREAAIGAMPRPSIPDELRRRPEWTKAQTPRPLSGMWHIRDTLKSLILAIELEAQKTGKREQYVTSTTFKEIDEKARQLKFGLLDLLALKPGTAVDVYTAHKARLLAAQTLHSLNLAAQDAKRRRTKQAYQYFYVAKALASVATQKAEALYSEFGRGLASAKMEIYVGGRRYEAETIKKVLQQYRIKPATMGIQTFSDLIKSASKKLGFMPKSNWEKAQEHAKHLAKTLNISEEEALKGIQELFGVDPNERLKTEILEEIIRLAQEFENAPGTDEAKLKMFTDMVTDQQRKTFLTQSVPDMLYEAWINGLLSGIPTAMANILGNTSMTVLSVAERFVAEKVVAPLHRLMSSTPEPSIMPGETAAFIHGLCSAFRDSFSIAAKALKDENFLHTLSEEELQGLADLRIQEVLRTRAISPENIGWDSPFVNWFRKYADGLGAVIRIPTRVLTATDVFFRSLLIRAERHAIAFRHSLEKTPFPQTPIELGHDMQWYLENPTNEDIEAARQFGAEKIFQAPLGPIGESLKETIYRIPTGRLMFPFMRTAINIAKQAIYMSPIGVLSPRFLKSQGIEKELMAAKLLLGMGAVFTFLPLIAAGYITGEGPSDEETRALMRSQGWQPYSIFIGDSYYSYNRLEPIGSVLGLLANVAEKFTRLPDDKKFLSIEQAVSIAQAFGEVIGEKTYLKGLANIVDSIQKPEVGTRQILASFVKSLTPTFVRYAEKAADPMVQRTKGIFEDWVSSIPWLSQAALYPRRNIFGEPVVLSPGFSDEAYGPGLLGAAYTMVSPILRSRPKADPVAEEIIRVGARFSMPEDFIMGTRPPTYKLEDPKMTQGVQLTAEQYDRYVRLAGNELKVNGKGMKEALAALFKTPYYKSLSDGPDGGKAALIVSIINRYRALARQQLIREYPELSEFAERKARWRASRKRPEIQIGVTE